MGLRPVPHLPHLPGLGILTPGTLGSCAFRNERWVCTPVATFLEHRVAPGGGAWCPSDPTGKRRQAPRVLYQLAPRKTHWPPETCTSCPCVCSFSEIKLHFFAPSTIFICPSRAWSPAHSGPVNRLLINEQKRLGSVRGGLYTGGRVPRAPGLEAHPGPGSGSG